MSTHAHSLSVLVVDDDPSILGAVKRILHGKAQLTLEVDPVRASALLASDTQFSVIVCDLRMPGMDGLTLLQHARKVAPNTVRILLSGALDLSDTIALVNDCQVFRIILKPFASQALVDAVLAAGEQHRLAEAERVLLEETLQGSVQMLAEVFLLVQPAGFGRAMRLRRHVSDLARQLGVTRRWDVEVAALLSQIGSITLSAETLDRWYNGRPMNDAEQAQVAGLSRTAQALIANIPRMETVREILRLQDAPPSDPGVPPGARMLAIARDFDLLIAQGENAENALAILQRRKDRYDPDYLEAFRAVRGKSAPKAEIREMRLSDVEESMVLASDVYSPTGFLLIARGQRVTPGLAERIQGAWGSFAASHTVRVIVQPRN